MSKLYMMQTLKYYQILFFYFHNFVHESCVCRIISNPNPKILFQGKLCAGRIVHEMNWRKIASIQNRLKPKIFIYEQTMKGNEPCSNTTDEN